MSHAASPHAARGPFLSEDPASPYGPRDACGVGFIARQDGARTHEVVALALEASARLAHRGAASTDLSADGAGVLTQIPRRLFILAASRQGIPLPADAAVGVGMLFLPAEAEARAQAEALVTEVLLGDGIPLLGVARRARAPRGAGRQRARGDAHHPPGAGGAPRRRR